MKRLINKKISYRKLLQSLPVRLAAIVFVLYALSFWPLSVEKMGKSVALVERTAYFQITANGRNVACFKEIGGDGLPTGMSLKPDSTVIDTKTINACWCNKYTLFPSCDGTMLTANPDQTAIKRLLAAGKDIPGLIRKKTDSMAVEVARLEKTKEEIDYYLRVHNVNDDGYNVMAELDESVKDKIEQAKGILAALKSAQTKRHLEIKLIRKFTLLYNDTAGTVRRKACKLLTTDKESDVCMLQTVKWFKPKGTKAVYAHRWFSPSPEAGDSLVVASIPGCTLYGFKPETAEHTTLATAATDSCRHGLPPLLAPDGAPVFTRGGQFVGINVGGRIAKSSGFGFALNKLRP